MSEREENCVVSIQRCKKPSLGSVHKERFMNYRGHACFVCGLVKTELNGLREIHIYVCRYARTYVCVNVCMHQDIRIDVHPSKKNPVCNWRR